MWDALTTFACPTAQPLYANVMNKSYTEFHLNEALEQLQQTLAEIEGSDYEETDLRSDIEHLYHHLNTAWNARHASDQEVEECTQVDFDRWRQFPKDLELT